ncbi:MAG: rod shape-determining protein MreC, partial [Butyricicoccus pullicaecorum]|nr:rod shape-determining protein MreC [Butyricicoccus pullicaecorum]
VGIAEGDYALMDEGNLKLAYLDPDSGVVIGDTVETSGRGGVFPKGIMIGTVERVMIEENGMDNYAVIRPFVDPATVTDVYVITDVTSGQVQSTDQTAADAAAE